MAKPYKMITKEILLGLALGGMFVIAATSPPAANIILRYLQKRGRLKKLENKKKFYNALYKIKKSRLIIISEKENGVFVVGLTEKGKRKIKEIQYENLKIPKPKKWDGVWRIVSFDIPKAKNKARDALREKLKILGFFQFQESAWAFPYPCDKEIEFLVELFGIYPYVQIIEAQKIQNDLALKKHFHLL